MKRLILIIFLFVFIFQINAAAAYDNIAAGKKYSFSAEPSLSNPDSEGKKLTDGLYAAVKEEYYYTDTAFVGFNQISFDTEGNFFVTIDLGEVFGFIKEFEFSYLNEVSAGVFAPASVTVLISETADGTYNSVGTLDIEPDTSDNSSFVKKEKITADTEVNGRYVRFMFHNLGEYVNENDTTVNTNWIFIDELSVYSQAATTQTGDASKTAVIAALLLIVSFYSLFKISRIFKHKTKF